MSDEELKPPLPGMKVIPFGWPAMAPAFLGLLTFAIGVDECRKEFKAETGHDLDTLARSNHIERMIDQATGRDKEMFGAFADWVAVNLWGDGSESDGPCIECELIGKTACSEHCADSAGGEA